MCAPPNLNIIKMKERTGVYDGFAVERDSCQRADGGGVAPKADVAAVRAG